MDEPESTPEKPSTVLQKTLGGVAGAVTLTVVAVYPPKGPAWPYLAYTVVALLWLAWILSLPALRKFTGERYDRLGHSSRVLGAAMVGALVVAGIVLWLAYLPEASRVIIARGFSEAQLTQGAAAPQPADSSTEPLVVVTEPAAVVTPAPQLVLPATLAPAPAPAPIDPEAERLRQRVAELEAMLAEAAKQSAPPPQASSQPAASVPTSAPATEQGVKPETPPAPRQIPQVPGVTPTADELVTLSAYLVLGQNLRGLYIRERGADEVEAQVNAWYRASLQYIDQYLGVDYAARYRTTRPSGMGIAGFPWAKMGMVDGIDSRLQHLVTFLTELRQRR